MLSENRKNRYDDTSRQNRHGTELRVREQIDPILSRWNHSRQRITEEKSILESAREKVENVAHAQKIFQLAAQSVQETIHQRIAGIVTRCLQSVFADDSYRFRVEFVRKRGRTEARFTLKRDGIELGDLLDSVGGGVADVISFALRLAGLMMGIPRRRRLLVLDEPWKALSSQYRPAVRDLVQSLARELGIQFLIVSHDPVFQLGKIFET